MSWLLILGLKEGLVKCATVCIKIEVLLLSRVYFKVTKVLVPIVMVSYIILTRSSSSMCWPREARKAFYP